MADDIKKVLDSLRQMQKSLECSICLELLDNPHSTKCNHQFCWHCINQVIEKSSKKVKNKWFCPLCKTPVSRRSLTPNPKLANIISAVRNLHDAVKEDTGTAGTPPYEPFKSSTVTGTPGCVQFSLEHPTPQKSISSSAHTTCNKQQNTGQDTEQHPNVVPRNNLRRSKRNRNTNTNESTTKKHICHTNSIFVESEDRSDYGEPVKRNIVSNTNISSSFPSVSELPTNKKPTRKTRQNKPTRRSKRASRATRKGLNNPQNHPGNNKELLRAIDMMPLGMVHKPAGNTGAMTEGLDVTRQQGGRESCKSFNPQHLQTTRSSQSAASIATVAEADSSVPSPCHPSTSRHITCAPDDGPSLTKGHKVSSTRSNVLTESDSGTLDSVSLLQPLQNVTEKDKGNNEHLLSLSGHLQSKLNENSEVSAKATKDQQDCGQVIDSVPQQHQSYEGVNQTNLHSDNTDNEYISKAAKSQSTLHTHRRLSHNSENGIIVGQSSDGGELSGTVTLFDGTYDGEDVVHSKVIAANLSAGSQSINDTKHIITEDLDSSAGKRNNDLEFNRQTKSDFENDKRDLINGSKIVNNTCSLPKQDVPSVVKGISVTAGNVACKPVQSITEKPGDDPCQADSDLCERIKLRKRRSVASPGTSNAQTTSLSKKVPLKKETVNKRSMHSLSDLVSQTENNNVMKTSKKAKHSNSCDLQATEEDEISSMSPINKKIENLQNVRRNTQKGTENVAPDSKESSNSIPDSQPGILSKANTPKRSPSLSLCATETALYFDKQGENTYIHVHQGINNYNSKERTLEASAGKENAPSQLDVIPASFSASGLTQVSVINPMAHMTSSCQQKCEQSQSSSECKDENYDRIDKELHISSNGLVVSTEESQSTEYDANVLSSRVDITYSIETNSNKTSSGTETMDSMSGSSVSKGRGTAVLNVKDKELTYVGSSENTPQEQEMTVDPTTPCLFGDSQELAFSDRTSTSTNSKEIVEKSEKYSQSGENVEQSQCSSLLRLSSENSESQKSSSSEGKRKRRKPRKIVKYPTVEKNILFHEKASLESSDTQQSSVPQSVSILQDIGVISSEDVTTQIQVTNSEEDVTQIQVKSSAASTTDDTRKGPCRKRLRVSEEFRVPHSVHHGVNNACNEGIETTEDDVIPPTPPIRSTKQESPHLSSRLRSAHLVGGKTNGFDEKKTFKRSEKVLTDSKPVVSNKGKLLSFNYEESRNGLKQCDFKKKEDIAHTEKPSKTRDLESGTKKRYKSLQVESIGKPLTPEESLNCHQSCRIELQDEESYLDINTRIGCNGADCQEIIDIEDDHEPMSKRINVRKYIVDSEQEESDDNVLMRSVFLSQHDICMKVNDCCITAEATYGDEGDMAMPNGDESHIEARAYGDEGQNMAGTNRGDEGHVIVGTDLGDNGDVMLALSGRSHGVENHVLHERDEGGEGDEQDVQASRELIPSPATENVNEEMEDVNSVCQCSQESGHACTALCRHMDSTSASSFLSDVPMETQDIVEKRERVKNVEKEMEAIRALLNRVQKEREQAKCTDTIMYEEQCDGSENEAIPIDEDERTLLSLTPPPPLTPRKLLHSKELPSPLKAVSRYLNEANYEDLDMEACDDEEQEQKARKECVSSSKVDLLSKEEMSNGTVSESIQQPGADLDARTLQLELPGISKDPEIPDQKSKSSHDAQRNILRNKEDHTLRRSEEEGESRGEAIVQYEENTVDVTPRFRRRNRIPLVAVEADDVRGDGSCSDDDVVISQDGHQPSLTKHKVRSKTRLDIVSKRSPAVAVLYNRAIDKGLLSSHSQSQGSGSLKNSPYQKNKANPTSSVHPVKDYNSKNSQGDTFSSSHKDAEHESCPARSPRESREVIDKVRMVKQVSSPVEVKGSRSLSFVTTRLSRDLMSKARSLAQRYGGRLASEFNKKTTHVIMATDETRQVTRCSYTMKYLLGLALGKWIVSHLWVTACLEANTLVSEEDFEVKGDNDLGQSHIPRVARKARSKKHPLLFRDHSALCVGEFKGSVSKAKLCQLLEFCGARVSSCGAEFRKDKEQNQECKHVLVVDKEDGKAVKIASGLCGKYNVSAVSLEWVTDSIANFSAQEFEIYTLTCDEDSQNTSCTSTSSKLKSI